MPTEIKETQKCVIHIFQRSKRNKDYYRCIAPRCTSYFHKADLEGKEALCTKCKAPFLLDRMQLKNKNTVCLMCSKSPKRLEAEAAQDVMTNLINELDKIGEIKNENND